MSEQKKRIAPSGYKICIPDCPICGGVGYVSMSSGDIHDPNFGKMKRCPNMKYKWYNDSIGIPKEDAVELDWDKYAKTDAVVNIRAAMDKLFDRGYGWLYVYGQPGNGKTIMVKSATIYASAVLAMEARYRRLSDLMNIFRSTYDNENGQTVYREALKRWGSYKFLAIDEIGRDRQTDFGKQTLSELMDRRYTMATSRKGITVWVSNFAPEEVLERYQSDRVRDGRFTVLEVKTASVRPAMDYENNNDEGEEELLWWQK